MSSKRYDVVIYDAVGMPYSGSEDSGLGGSEFAVIRLSKALAACGKRVLVKCSLPAGSVYVGDDVEFSSVHDRDDIETKVMILQRYSRVPNHIGFNRLLIQVHDMPDLPTVEYQDQFFTRWPTTTLICNTEWQRQLYPTQWRAAVIPALLPDIMKSRIPARRVGHFVYASAAMKGLPQTVDAWTTLRKHYPQLVDAKLHVISSWDVPFDPKDESIVLEGQLTSQQLGELIGSVEGTFYVNRFPETFCVTAAMAEALGTRNHILCLNGFGALGEVLSGAQHVTDDGMQFEADFISAYGLIQYPIRARRDYSVVAGVKRWLEVLKEPRP